MDADRRMKLFMNRKGLVLVWFALLVVVMFGFLGLAVDMGYMYVATGQLQNAADSAALAGAARLPNQAFARSTAETYGEKNLVVPSTTRVAIAAGDVELGHWNRNATPPFNPSGTPINAVKVRANRTEGSEGGAVDLFFSKVLDARWARMGTWAEGIAAKLPAGGFYFVLGQGVCNSTTMPVIVSPAPATNNMAWTTFLQQSTNTNDVLDNYICPANRVPNEDVCGQNIYTSNAVSSQLFKGVETDFFDPNYDAAHKTMGVDSRGNSVVTTWTVIVPVSAANNPGDQPNPLPVWGYARIRMIRACGTGASAPCDRAYKAPSGVCGSENDIVIDQVECVSCENSTSMVGAKARLVQ